MVYQPKLELLNYLRANDFKTFIVSGGGIEFMRPWTERVYGIPPEQVVGSSIRTQYEVRDGEPVLARIPELNFIDDKAGKPVGINQHIGRLSRGLDEGPRRGWTIVNMREDWSVVFHSRPNNRAGLLPTLEMSTGRTTEPCYLV